LTKQFSLSNVKELLVKHLVHFWETRAFLPEGRIPGNQDVSKINLKLNFS
jgi:hypothetical protein